MQMEEVTAFTADCFHGEPASCSSACPFHLDIRAFMEKAGKGRWLAAYKALRDAVVFPVIVSALCEQPCRERCQRPRVGDKTDAALAVRDIEAACIRYAKNHRAENYVIPPKDRRVAVVGAGPAGLACALHLAQKKFPVTIFEKEATRGGTLRTHNRYAEFEADIATQFAAVTAEFRYNSPIATLAELEEFDAIYVATGAGGQDFGLLSGWSGDLQTTDNPKVFLGGALAGLTLMDSIARGAGSALTIEIFLKTGKASHSPSVYNQTGCGHYLEHKNVAGATLVTAASADGYSEDEARAEAGRCLQCDCKLCLTDCAMLRMFRKNPHKIAVEVYNDMGVNPPFSVHTITREVYSCNVCGYCQSICPEGVDIGALLRFSRSVRLQANVHPAALHDFWLREMAFATGEGAFTAAPPEQTTCEYLFYPGCQLGAANPEHVLGSYRLLAQHLRTGIMLGCCGAPAYWAGDDALMAANHETIREQWRELGRPRMIFACATCADLFRRFLPEIPGVSLYELLARIFHQASASDSPSRKNEISGLTPMPAPLFPLAAIFDPCAARGDEAMAAGVRRLAAQAGVTLEELPEHHRCCGHGGHMRVANAPLFAEITRQRTEASPRPYIVYCANCREVFAERGKECAHILDLVLSGAGRPEANESNANESNNDARTTLARGVPELAVKRQNSLRVKKELMREITGTAFQPTVHPWDTLRLTISPELRAAMTRKLISADDLKEIIWQAETTGDKFITERDNSTAPTSLACLVKPLITFWVEYQTEPDGAYKIVSAYSHRMRFDREE